MASAAAALMACGGALLSASGPGADERRQRAEALQAVRQCLEQEAQRSGAELLRQAARQEELRQELEEGCAAAEQQHEGISSALAELARQLDCLSIAGGSAASSQRPLLGLHLPDSYALACTTLLDRLALYVEHHSQQSHHSGDNRSSSSSSGGATGDLGAAAQLHQRRAAELQQLQSCLCKGERLRVEEEAEIARLQAELEVLQAPTATTAASLGYSAADLEQEVSSLRGRQAASLQQAVAAAEAAAAAAAGADAVEEQTQQRQAVVEQRLQAKQQVATMLAQHLARQLLVRQLLQQEQAVMQQVQATAAAARADAGLVLLTILDRLPGYDAQQQQQRRQQQEEEQQTAAASGTSPEAGTAGAAAAAAAGAGPDPVATAEELLACREQLQQLSAAVHSDTLPAQRAVFAQLHALLYRSSSDASSSSSSGAAAGQPQQPELSAPELQAQLAAVAATHGAFLGQASALLTEIQERQAAPEQRHLAEQVLVDFWSRPGRLGAVAAQQREALEKFV